MNAVAPLGCGRGASGARVAEGGSGVGRATLSYLACEDLHLLPGNSPRPFLPQGVTVGREFALLDQARDNGTRDAQSLGRFFDCHSAFTLHVHSIPRIVNMQRVLDILADAVYDRRARRGR